MILFSKKKLTHVVASFAVSAAIVLASCSKDDGAIGPDGSPSDIIFPSSNVSYSQHVQPLFNQTCANVVGCHSQAETGDRVKLDNYQNLRFGVRGLPVVIAGNAAGSELVTKIEGTGASGRMPLNRNPLNQNQINGIRAWINEGARDN